MFGPQPRSYEFDMPKKVRVGAVRAALAQKLNDGAVIIVDRLETADGKTKGTVEMFRRLGVSGKALVIDVKPDEKFVLTARNIAEREPDVGGARYRARHHGHVARDCHTRGDREAAGIARLVASRQWPVSSEGDRLTGNRQLGTGNWKLETDDEAHRRHQAPARDREDHAHPGREPDAGVRGGLRGHESGTSAWSRSCSASKVEGFERPFRTAR